MSRSFDGIPGFVAFLITIPVEIEAGIKAGLEEAAKLVEKTAKEAIGTYTFGWPPLQPETIARKGADTPLLETGDLQASISHVVEGHEAQIGTNDYKALWMELGTSRIPPRPFMSESAIRTEKEVVRIIGSHFATAIVGSYVKLIP